MILPPNNFTQHVLTSSASTYINRYWLFLDTETKPRTVEGVTSHYFYLGWTCFWIHREPLGKDSYEWVFHITFDGLNRYIENLTLRLGALHVVGHNIFFDLQASGFYQYFTEHKWKLKFYYDKGLTYILKCRKSGAAITILSSTNWFDFSLEKLGDKLGYPKGEIDFDTCTKDELKKYCRVDVEILVKALKIFLEFITEHDLGKSCLTKASQAFTAYRHRFMEKTIYLHRHEHINELEREAYIGGRCECFRLGKISGGPFITVDVNSMYPYVMKAEKYPYKLAGYYVNKSPEFFRERITNLAIIAEVEVNTTEPVFAIKANGKTIFPTGRFNCIVCSTGFKYAFENGYINTVVKAALYRKADLFTSYVDYFHDLRIDFKYSGNDIMELLCKYMHNSLYGKFGQLKIISEYEDEDNGCEYTREDVYNMNTGRFVTITHMMNQRLMQWMEGEGVYSNVAIAAHITENARFYLWSLFQKVGRSKVLYCDTDSLKIRQKDLGKLSTMIDPDDLGSLKIEDISQNLVIDGAKNYRTENVRKIKGIPRKAKEVEPGVFTFEAFVRQIGHLRSGQIIGAQTKTVTRKLKHVYSKGKVLTSGKVIPFHLPAPE